MRDSSGARLQSLRQPDKAGGTLRQGTPGERLWTYLGVQRYALCPGSTDAHGKISAQGLRLGMYLVRRVAFAPANDRALVDPMLISVPSRVDDSLEYQVIANPKVEIEEVVPGPTDPGVPESNGIFPWFDLPTTGDVQMLLVGLIALLGGSMIVVSRRVTR